MKAIILAAGKGTRLRPLTNDRPKPMVLLKGRPLLEHILEYLPSKITEIVLVVGYRRDVIQNYFGTSWKNRPITYVVQEEQLGNGHALTLCRSLLEDGERFLVMFADDLHSKDSIARLLNHTIGLLTYTADNPRAFGVVETDTGGVIANIEEKPEYPKTNNVAVGVYVLDTRIFDYAPKIIKGEYYLTGMIDNMIKDVAVHAEQSSFWHPISSPEDLERAKLLF